jgi:hypothetical protein
VRIQEVFWTHGRFLGNPRCAARNNADITNRSASHRLGNRRRETGTSRSRPGFIDIKLIKDFLFILDN